uniref:SERRATE/Ars2 N-terminal domain-containing protein n=1 Tax=Tetranychus urticae TaxID=32264 RepID=T1KU48_TETUR
MNRSGGDGRYSSDRYGNQRRDRYGSPGDRSDMSPPMKRVRNTRPEWEDRAHTLSSAAAAAAAFNSNASPATHQSTGPTQPPMMTFKQFLGTQDDSVDDMEAVRKYNDYKTEFKKQQISDFFTAHKEEECGLTYRQYNLPGQESYFILSVNFINCFFDVFAHGSEKRLKSICFILFNILSYLSQVVDLISLIIYNQSIKSEVS